eukprot:3551497-Amphidinium_carterae.2
MFSATPQKELTDGTQRHTRVSNNLFGQLKADLNWRIPVLRFNHFGDVGRLATEESDSCRLKKALFQPQSVGASSHVQARHAGRSAHGGLVQCLARHCHPGAGHQAGGALQGNMCGQHHAEDL